jgi:PKD repeat protein
MRKLAFVLPLLAMSGCSWLSSTATTTSTTPSPAQTVFTAASALSAAELAASAYESLPTANAAVKAQIKAYDNTAYNIVQPLVAAAASGQSVVTAAEAEAAQAAVTTLTNYETSNGVK